LFIIKIYNNVESTESFLVYQDIDGILAVLAAILHITDIQFVEDPETDGVFIENEKLPTIGVFLIVVS